MKPDTRKRVQYLVGPQNCYHATSALKLELSEWLPRMANVSLKKSYMPTRGRRARIANLRLDVWHKVYSIPPFYANDLSTTHADVQVMRCKK